MKDYSNEVFITDMDKGGSGSCPIAVWSISGIELSASVSTVLVVRSSKLFVPNVKQIQIQWSFM
jgi:hypothetical protein